jgi:hypothetical protein
MGVTQESGGDTDVNTWLLQHREYIRSVRDAGDGSYYVTPPKRALAKNDVDDDDDLVMLPADVAGQLGIEKDPLMFVYELPFSE